MLLPSNLELCIDGTIFMKDGVNQGFFYSGSGISNVHIFGYGTLDVNGANQTTVNAYGISMGNSSNIVIENITVANSFYFPITIAGCTNLLQRNITVINPQNTGSTGLGVAGNQAISEASENCWIVNCNVNNTKDQAIGFYGEVYNSGAIGNVVDGAVYGICVFNDSGQAPPAENISIIGNIVTACTYPGLFVATNSGGTGFHSNIIITDNQIYSNSSNSIYISNAANCIISDNLCHDNQSGMYLSSGESGSGYFTVTGNRIFNEGQGTSAGTGIDVSGTLPNLMISNNFFYDTQSTPTMQYALQGVPSGNQYTQYGNSYFNLSVQPSYSENQRTERAIAGFSYSTAAGPGVLVGITTITWNTAFPSAADYVAVVTCEAGLTAIIAAKTGAAIEIYLYSIQEIDTAGFAYLDAIAAAI
jgi:parallel beta-helix repeat protein